MVNREIRVSYAKAKISVSLVAMPPQTNGKRIEVEDKDEYLAAVKEVALMAWDDIKKELNKELADLSELTEKMGE